MRKEILFFLIIIIGFLVPTFCNSATKFEGQVIQWKPGVEGGIPDVQNKLVLTIDLFEGSNAAEIIQQAIDNVETPGAVLLPAGDLELTSPLILKDNVVLRGQGSSETRLIFDLPYSKQSGAIRVRGQAQEIVPVNHTVSMGSYRVAPESLVGLNEGQLVCVSSENDPALMYTEPQWNVAWAERSPGQIVRINKVKEAHIEFDTPIRLEHKESFNPQIQKINPIQNVGIENLYVERLDQAEDHVIYIFNALNCWVKDVESFNCMRSHVFVATSRFITVEGSYFHHAHDYGGGGHGYGVASAYHASDCLVTNNIFQSLRHSMLVQLGANGNVYSYNYSLENVGYLPDGSIHGHYSYANLFEGNVLQEIFYADYWGPTGPSTTSFRNYVKERIRVKDHSHKSNVIGNVVEKMGITIEENCLEVVSEDNQLLKGTDLKIEGIKNLPDSLYLKSKPKFWGNKPWPFLGFSGSKRRFLLPAEDRYIDLKNYKLSEEKTE